MARTLPQSRGRVNADSISRRWTAILEVMARSSGLLARLAGGLLLVGCGGSSADAVYVRLRNDTQYDFTGVGVAGVEFGPLRAGQLSPYQMVDGSMYELEGGFANTTELQFWGQLTDHLGDRPLPHGRYTYGIGVTPDLSALDTDGSVFFSIH